MNSLGLDTKLGVFETSHVCHHNSISITVCGYLTLTQYIKQNISIVLCTLSFRVVLWARAQGSTISKNTQSKEKLGTCVILCFAFENARGFAQLEATTTFLGLPPTHPPTK